MFPYLPQWRIEDLASQREAEECVRTTKDFLVAGDPERCWRLLICAPTIDPCVPRGEALYVIATALRAAQHERLPRGAPEPYSVFGLIPTVPATRDPAVIERYYRRASDVLNHTGPYYPCAPAFAQTARLVADTWDFLSDSDRKTSLDSRFEDEATAAAPTAPPQPALQMTPPPPPTVQAITAQAGLDGLGRGKRLKKPVNRMNL
ncbi:uncharacterized protein LOC120700842 [Panicum virgatum]|uniref:uncharacterized protein LOC120700842 n=1 Tax=Panicum virgatum TaxID=38727 RepID=UPI0019D50442|nr:uncharacterized protein LOC120700842 [Panicum virgatum]